MSSGKRYTARKFVKAPAAPHAKRAWLSTASVGRPGLPGNFFDDQAQAARADGIQDLEDTMEHGVLPSPRAASVTGGLRPWLRRLARSPFSVGPTLQRDRARQLVLRGRGRIAPAFEC